MANSLRQAIMDVVFDEGPQPTAAELFSKMRFATDIHHTVHQIWALQKSGELTFKERKGAGGGLSKGDLVDISLTPFGTRRVQRERGITIDIARHDRPFVEVPLAVVEKLRGSAGEREDSRKDAGVQNGIGYNKSLIQASSGKPKKVGVDPTDYRTQPTKTTGGEITRTYVAPEPRAKKLDAATFQQQYPLVYSLVMRESKVLEAAALLEQAGMKEMADEAMNRVSYTEFEKEVITMAKELYR